MTSTTLYSYFAYPEAFVPGAAMIVNAASVLVAGVSVTRHLAYDTGLRRASTKLLLTLLA